MDYLDGKTRDAIRTSIEYVASRCDHATSRDNEGFSSNNASIGHELSRLPDRYWNDGTYVAAARIAYKHRNQAIKGGVLEDDMAEVIKAVADGPVEDEITTSWVIRDQSTDGIVLSVPWEMRELVSKLRRVPGASQPAKKGRLWVVNAEDAFVLSPYLKDFTLHEDVESVVQRSLAAAPQDKIISVSPRHIDAENGVFFIKFPYDPDVVDLIKENNMRHYNGQAWVVTPAFKTDRILDKMIEDHEFFPSDKARELLEETRKKFENAKEDNSVQINIQEHDDLVELKFAYNPEVVKAIKFMDTKSRRYSPVAKTWFIDKKSIPELLERFDHLRIHQIEISKEAISTLHEIAGIEEFEAPTSGMLPG